MRRSSLERESETSGISWVEWIMRESSKRLLCGLFIYSNLLVVLYDIAPWFDTTQDLEIELLDEDELWNSSTNEKWEVLNQQKILSPNRTIPSVLVDMLSATTQDRTDLRNYSISGFTALTITHAVNVHVWHLKQFSQSLNKSSIEVAGYSPNILLSATLIALSSCREVLRHSRPDPTDSLWSNPEDMLSFNCEAILRVVYTSLFTNVDIPQRMMLLCDSTADRPASLKAFLAAR